MPLTTNEPALVVVGAGQAGAHAAMAAREHGFAGRVTVIGDEHVLPYERPPLSKEVLRGEAEPASARVAHAERYESLGIEVRTGARVQAIDRPGQRVVLADGSSIPYVALVLATGAEPNRLPVQGAHLHGVHHLRTLDDSIAIRDALRSAARAAVVGAGWIGSEVAASARQQGCDVVLVDPAPVPLHRVLGPTIGQAFRELHAAHGVQLHLGAKVIAVHGSDHVEAIVLDDRSTIDVDVVIVGIGVRPRTELAELAGLTVGNGIVVDDRLRTNDPRVFAAGDVAQAWHPWFRQHVRVEHWDNALHQGQVAGRNAAGAGARYDRLPYFFSDQYDASLEYVGHHQPDHQVHVEGDLAGLSFVARWQRVDGSTSAAMAVNGAASAGELEQLVLGGQRVGVG